MPQTRPGGPFARASWRSPLRGPWLTSLLGLTLLPLILVVAITGLLSNAAYDPRLGQNSIGRNQGPLDFYLFSWPTSPSWLYAVTQGLHVIGGLVATPILIAKLWAVIPRLFEWPPLRSAAHALERASLALLVGGGVFEFATGIINIQTFYPFHFFFTDAHYYGAWVFIAALTLHVALKLPFAIRQLRRPGLAAQLRQSIAETVPEPRELAGVASPEGETSLISVNPAAATMSRRGLLALVGGGSFVLLVGYLGESVGGPLRQLAFLAPHGRSLGDGPTDFQINRTAAAAAIDPAQVGSRWRLELQGRRRRALSRQQLLSLPQHTYHLPIACVEGWSTTQRWTGVRLADLARLAGHPGPVEVTATSLEQNGLFNVASFSAGQVADHRSLLALKVNGADLSLDHGFPARVIVPAAPGVHCTKWVAQLNFQDV